MKAPVDQSNGLTFYGEVHCNGREEKCHSSLVSFQDELREQEGFVSDGSNFLVVVRGGFSMEEGEIVQEERVKNVVSIKWQLIK